MKNVLDCVYDKRNIHVVTWDTDTPLHNWYFQSYYQKYVFSLSLHLTRSDLLKTIIITLSRYMFY